MKFGVFDHLDASGAPLAQHYENRLRLIEAYDAAGFHGYHLAEHHSTPLGCAPSPGIFLSSVAQRTRHIRFGPLVYLLPCYHPLRLIEEISMLDQLSQGRFQLGVGQGVVPFELNYYGVDPERAHRMYVEALDLILRGLSSELLSFEGEFYRFKDVPMTVHPLQRPHPPLWYGVGHPESCIWAAANNVNVVTIALPERTRMIAQRYRAEWRALGKSDQELPCIGVSRHIVVADSDRRALEIARRAYPLWRKSFQLLWDQHRVKNIIEDFYPPDWDNLQNLGNGFAGSPTSLREYLAAQFETGINYFVSWLAFGDLSLDESMRSVELFSREVMPHFAEP